MKTYLLALSLILAACSAPEDAGTKAGSEAKLHAEEVDYTANGVVLKGYLAYDERVAGPRPGVLVVHEWWGHNEYTRKRARMLAEMGYTALAVDMYGDGKNTQHPADAGKFMNAVMQNMSAAEARFNAGLDLLKSHATTDPEKVAAIGYCFGGGVVLHMARIGTDLDGVVSFHGSLSSMKPAEPGMVKARILACHGAEDPFEPPEVVQKFKQEMDAAGADYRFVAYPGAVHSFTNPAADSIGKKFDLPLAYNAEADRHSWDEMKKFFGEIF